MVTHTKPAIDFSTFPESDGEPMAETLANKIQMVDLEFALQNLFALQGRTRVAVGGNQFVYYNQHSGLDHCSPDVYVVFDVTPPPPPKWQTWVEGKFPDIVFEITSPSTQDVDVSAEPRGKLRLYAEQGAREYYIYDPQQEMIPVFRGYELCEGRMESLPLLPSGGIMSPLLRTELRPMDMGATERRPAGTWLRVIDPTNGQPIRIADEEHRDLLATREELTGTREELTAEAQARRAAEERAARAEAALQALLAEQAGRQARDMPAEDAE